MYFLREETMEHTIIPIDSIIISSRIRKSLGNLQSLADNIREIGLLSPIVVNEEYQLLAGERRLEACKLLGWTEVDVSIISTVDAEAEIAVEISENNMRKDFTREELINAGISLERIEKIKAEEYRNSKLNNSSVVMENFPQRENGAVRDIVAAKLGMSGKQYEREKFIVQHKDYINPGEFNDWNNRLVSTNKIFTAIKRIIDPSVNKSSKDDDKKESTKETVVEKLPDDYDDLKKAASKVDELKKKTEELETTIAAKDREIDSLLEQDSPAPQDNSELLRKLDALQKSLDEKDKEIARLSSQDIDRFWTPDYFTSSFNKELTDTHCLREFCQNATVLFNRALLKSGDIRVIRALRNDEAARQEYLELLDFISDWLKKEYTKANANIVVIDSVIG